MFTMCDYKEAQLLELNDTIRLNDDFVQVDNIVALSSGNVCVYYIPVDRVWIDFAEEEEPDYFDVSPRLNVAIYRWEQ